MDDKENDYLKFNKLTRQNWMKKLVGTTTIDELINLLDNGIIPID